MASGSALLLIAICSTAAFAQDTDGDGLSDADETGVHGTDPLLPDTDGDGVGDYAEAIRFATDPLDDDSDDDGLLDGQESLTPSGFALPVLVTGQMYVPDATGDVDGDGDLDLFFATPFNGVSWVETSVAPVGATFGASQLLTDNTTMMGCSPVRLEDVDDDGDLDVIRSEEFHHGPPDYISEHGLRIIENRLDEPTANFGPPTHLSLLEAGKDIRFVDLDGDGRHDLWQHGECGVAFESTRWSRRSTLPGPLSFDFTQQLGTTLPYYQTPVQTALEDFDGDGDRDLVWVEGTQVWWSRNRLDEPSAGFGPHLLAATLDVGLYQFTGLRVVQMDATPRPEIVVWGESALQPIELWVLPNPLESRPATAAPLPSGPLTGFFGAYDAPADFAIVDLDGDGDHDLVSTVCIGAGQQVCDLNDLFPTAEVVWFENRFDEREPGWGPVEIIEDGVTATVQTETQTLAVDVDGDGDTDLLESSSVYGLRYFENVRHLGTDPLSNDSDGDGLLDGDEVKNHLTNPLRIDSDDDGLGDAIEVGIAGTDPNDPDHDDDGLLDGEEGATGGGPFATPRSMLAYESGAQFDLDLGDLDGDGKLDVVATAYGTAGIFENRLRTPEGDFRSWLHDPDVFSVAYGDGALLQGALGVPLAYVEGDGVSYRLFADVGSSPPFGNAVSTGGGSGAHHTRVRAVDFDGDGDEDALYGPFLAGGIQWNENRLEEPSADLGPVETLVIVSGLGSVTDWHPADLDGDDDLDLLVVEQTTNSVWWFENRRDEPSADFASAALVMAGGEHSGRVTAGDVDGDGDLDPIATTFRYGDLTWFENRLSTGQPFVEHVAGVSSDYVTRLLSEDMNGDGYADIVVGSATSGFDYGPQQIRVYESAGSPAPMAVQLIETGANNGGGDVVAVDIDDDGDVDLLASNGDELILIERLTNLETDPHDRDSDDDGFEDGLEVEHGSDPNDASSVPALQALPLGSFAALFVQVGLLCAIGVARLRVRATG